MKLWAALRDYLGVTLMEYGVRIMTDECKVMVRRRLREELE